MIEQSPGKPNLPPTEELQEKFAYAKSHPKSRFLIVIFNPHRTHVSGKPYPYYYFELFQEEVDAGNAPDKFFEYTSHAPEDVIVGIFDLSKDLDSQLTT